MIQFSSRNIRAYLYKPIVDMHKGFDGLYSLVKNSLDEDPLNGHLFLFLGRDGKRLKILYWDGTGLCLFHKRLSRGCFRRFWDTETGSLELSTSELQLLVEGSDLKNKYPLSPAPFKFK